MKRSFLRILCLTALVGMVFASCERENTTTDGKYTVTVLSANDQMGKAYGSGEFDAGTTTRIWGTPEVGYQFDHWNDGNTENPRNITVNENVTYTAYFSEIGHGGDTTFPGGGGGETPGEFNASFSFDGTTYNGIALVSFGLQQGVLMLAIYTGEGEADPISVVSIDPSTGIQTADGTTYTSCSVIFGSNDYVNDMYPHYATGGPATCQINVTALDMTANSITLSATGQLLDIATHQASGETVLKSYSCTMDGAWQNPGIPTGK